MSYPILVSGYDPTHDPDCVSPSELLQMVQAATFLPEIGGIITSSAAPNTTVFPEFRTWIWRELDSSMVPTGNFYYWNGSWTLFGLTNGAKLLNGSVTINKLSVAGGHPFEIIQINSAGSDYTFVLPENAIRNGVLPLNRLVPATNGDIARMSGGVWAAVALDQNLITSLLGTHSVPVDKLVNGLTGQFLGTVGTTVKWVDGPGTGGQQLPVIGAGDEHKHVRVNDTHSAYELVPEGSPPVKPEDITGGVDGEFLVKTGGISMWAGMRKVVEIPANFTNGASAIGNAHGLGGQPDVTDFRFVCVNPDLGYFKDQWIPLIVPLTNGGPGPRNAFVPKIDNINWTIIRYVDTGGVSMPHAISGVWTQVTNALNWKIQGRLARFI